MSGARGVTAAATCDAVELTGADGRTWLVPAEMASSLGLASAPLTCGVSEFARIVGIGEGTAREIVASAKHPPLIWAGREARIVRAEIPAWLAREGVRDA